MTNGIRNKKIHIWLCIFFVGKVIKTFIFLSFWTFTNISNWNMSFWASVSDAKNLNDFIRNSCFIVHISIITSVILSEAKNLARLALLLRNWSLKALRARPFAYAQGDIFNTTYTILGVTYFNCIIAILQVVKLDTLGVTQ